MTTRFVSDNLDLSKLPAPAVIKGVDYEAILAERIARLKELWPELDTEALETEPGVILQQADAFREMLTKAAINDAARAVMLSFATGTDLDNLAAFYGVERLVIQAATDTTPAVMESDTDFRVRVKLAPEQLPYAGMTGGGYRALARRTAPSVKDVSTIKRDGGHVDVILLAREGNGAVSNDVVASVYLAFQDDAATQLTDIVSVRSASITNYDIPLTLKVQRGPDPAAVKAAAEAAVRAYCASRHRVGKIVYRNMVEAAAAVGGVENAVAAMSDIDPGSDGAAFLGTLTTTVEVVG